MAARSPEALERRRLYNIEYQRARRKNPAMRKADSKAELARQEARIAAGLCAQCGGLPGLKGNSKTQRYRRCKSCFEKTHPAPYEPTEEDLALAYET